MNDPIDRLAAFLAQLHPAWQGRRWADMSESTRELFREDARHAVAIYEGADEREG